MVRVWPIIVSIIKSVLSNVVDLMLQQVHVDDRKMKISSTNMAGENSINIVGKQKEILIRI